MERDGIAFVHSPKEDLHYVGCKLSHLVSITALGADPENYPSDHRRRMAEFLSCLMNPRDERFIYDLRIVAESATAALVTTAVLMPASLRQLGYQA